MSVSPSCPVAGFSFARPKSRILTRPSRDTKTFSGFMSRCTMPLSCAVARPLAICTANSSILRTGIAPAPSRLRSVSPSSNSVTMYGAPSSLPMS